MKPIIGYSPVFWVILMLTGCTSFAGKLPPTYTYEQIPHVEQKPAVFYQFYDVKFSRYNGELDGRLSLKLRQEIKKIFLESGVFSSVEMTPSLEDDHILIKIETKSNYELLHILNGIVSIFTLLIIPGYERDYMTMTVEIYQQGGLVKQYIYKDYLDFWAHISLLLVMPFHSSQDGEQDLIDHMLMKFVHDVSADRILIKDASDK